MTRRYLGFAVAFALFVFLVPSVGALEAIYTRPEKDGNGKGIRVIYKLTEGGEIRLSDLAFDNGSATWSPDGTEIVFASERNGGFGEIFLMNADGTNQRSLGFDGEYPVISENYLAFETRIGNRDQCRVVRRDGSGAFIDLGLIEGFPAISPDETRVVFWNGSDDLVLANIDGSGSRRLTMGVMPSFVDDNTIVYQLDEGGGEIRIYDLLTDTERFLVDGVVPSVTDGWIVSSAIVGDLEGWIAVRPDGTGATLVAPYTRQGNFRVFGDLSPLKPDDGSPRAVEPRGKAALILGNLKRQ